MDSAAPDPKLMALETELRGKLGAQVKSSAKAKAANYDRLFQRRRTRRHNRQMAEQHGSDGTGFCGLGGCFCRKI